MKVSVGDAQLSGTVPPRSDGKTNRALVQVKTKQGWTTIGGAEVQPAGTFQLDIRPQNGKKKLIVRVVVPGVGRSKTMTVRV